MQRACTFQCARRPLEVSRRCSVYDRDIITGVISDSLASVNRFAFSLCKDHAAMDARFSSTYTVEGQLHLLI